MLDNDWCKVIRYVHKKSTNSHIYPSTYDIRVEILLSKYMLVYIWLYSGKLILLPYASTFYTKFVIKIMKNINGHSIIRLFIMSTCIHFYSSDQEFTIMLYKPYKEW